MTPADARPSIDGTGLTTEHYLELLDADLEALLAASADLSADVPGCPGWTVGDLLSHVIGVYRHKSAALSIDAEPERREPGWGELAAGDDPREVLAREYAELRRHLTARDAGVATWSWWPAEQTVGFWVRRMAQETAVHRWDAESAAYGVDAAGEIDADLAADGVDELLGWLRWDWAEVPQPEARGQRVLVSTGEHSWTLQLDVTAVGVEGGPGEAVALLAGEPSAVLLDLWGRPGQDVATGGDTEAVRLLRQRLAMVAS